ncbi:MAG: ElyC/SanA/YdcF family protein [Neisseria sp.]|nr:ElyC/SanA/YdcF family protein [Neisseria sp.]
MFTFLLIILSLALAADVFISFYTKKRSFHRAEQVPNCDFALVLGTAKYLKSGKVNLYYQNRINAAIALWQAGKVGAIVVSGHGLGNAISETECMQADLVAAGIPATAIWQDSAGLRTLDSIIRFQQKFPTQSVCIVSQPFHNQRALIQAQAHGIRAYALHAQVIGYRSGWKIHARERFSRLRLWYDLLFKRPARYSIQEIDTQQKPTQTQNI